MVNWDEVQKIIYPIKSYEDLCRRLGISFEFAFVRAAYNFQLPELEHYTQRLLLEDSRNRYKVYASQLIGTMAELKKSGIQNVLDLKERTRDREHMELFTSQVGIPAPKIALLLQYLVYWVIPGEKYLSGLVRNEPAIQESITVLHTAGFRTNLELLQAGLTTKARKVIVEKTRLAYSVILDLVNRADFSRLPWASKATISNIIGAGYGSLAELAKADPEQLYTDFMAYGKSIGKNLKLGNEIENSFRIAKIVPVILRSD